MKKKKNDLFFLPTDMKIAPLSQKAQSLKPGLYKHFKGGEYRVIGVGRLSEDREKEMVVYQSQANGYIWIRPLDMFLENVERDGHKGPRFWRVGD